MTVSAGAVTAQATAADAATPQGGTLTTAQTGLPATARKSETLSGAKLSGAKRSSAKLSKAARQRARASRAVAAAKSKIGSWYRYGGTGPRSFDCSGLVQYAWRKAGVKIPRVTTAQYRGIRTKVSWRNLRPGDLVFFHGKGHVGMYVGNRKMIHSPRTGKRVRIDTMNGWRKATFDGAVRPGG